MSTIQVGILPCDLQSSLILRLPDESATQWLGQALGQSVSAGLTVLLSGDLGAGKTSLVRALLQGLGHQGAVKSPTYSLLESYVLDAGIFHHFDLYRFESPEEFLEAGLDECFGQDAVCLVEWPDKAGMYLPPADLTVALSHLNAGREACIGACSKRGAQCLDHLTSLMT